jgi:hypothetical protein
MGATPPLDPTAGPVAATALRWGLLFRRGTLWEGPLCATLSLVAAGV